MAYYVKIALLLIVAGILLLPLMLPIIGFFLKKDTENQLYNTLKTTPDLDVNANEATRAVVVAKIYSKKPIKSELNSVDVVWINRQIRKDVYITSRDYSLPGGNANFSGYVDAYIIVDGVEISVDLSNANVLYELKVHRFETENRKFSELNETEQTVLEKEAEALGGIKETPGKVPLFKFQENWIENGEEIAIVGIYDPKEKRLSMPEGSALPIVRNWRPELNQRLFELCEINDPTVYVELVES